MRDFWISSGHHLLDRTADGGLLVTDEFLKAYLARPELLPQPESCAAERRLHESLLADPRRPVAADQVAALLDADARENFAFMLAFRDHLLRHPTLERAYLALQQPGALRVPPLFLDQLVHVILRNALDGCDDAFVLRAAEMMFREQQVAQHAGALIAADAETLRGISPSPVSPLVSMLGLPAAAEIEVLHEDNAETYFARSDRFDMALDLTAGRRGLAALARAVERWIFHLLGVAVQVEPLVEVRDAQFAWYVGLDAEGTKLGDAIWRDQELDAQALSRLIGLFRLTPDDPAEFADVSRGQTVYLFLAMTPAKSIRLKPQNLMTGLPLRRGDVLS